MATASRLEVRLLAVVLMQHFRPTFVPSTVVPSTVVLMQHLQVQLLACLVSNPFLSQNGYGCS